MEPCGDPEAWAPHLWPTQQIRLAQRRDNEVEVEIAVKNLGFVEAVGPTITVDKITDTGSLIGHSVGRPIEISPKLGPGESAVIRVAINLLLTKGSVGVVFHLNCDDSTGYSHSFGDGQRPIVFVSDRDGDWDIFMMNPDGTNQKNLTRDHHRNGWEDFGILSPDGKQILFDRLLSIDGKNRWDHLDNER